jgi:hypothetical protein
MSHPFGATLKEVLESGATDFVPAFGLPTGLPVATLNVDLSTLSAATDVALGFGEPVQEIADLNFQSGPDPRLEARALLYRTALHHRFLVPVRSVLILLRAAANHSRLTGQLSYVSGGSRVEFTYEVVRMWQQPVGLFLHGGLGLLPLAPLCQMPPDVPLADAIRTVVREIERRLLAETDHATAVRVMTATYILTGLRVDRATLASIYEGVRIMHESSAYQAILEEGRLQQVQEDLLELAGNGQGEPYGIARSVDLDSPRLVSHAIYSFIRRTELCVVDWTDWRPNIFFDLGVRLAVGKGRTVCVIDENHRRLAEVLRDHPEQAQEQVESLGLARPDDKGFSEVVNRFAKIGRQCCKLLELFEHLSYNPDSAAEQIGARIFDPYKPQERQRYRRPECRVVSAVRTIVPHCIDVQAEPVALPLHRELLLSALRFAKDQSEGLSPVLFPGNDRLKGLGMRAFKDRLIAAWKSLRDCYSNEQILQDQALFDDCNMILSELSPPSLHLPGELRIELGKMKKILNQAGRPKTP